MELTDVRIADFLPFTKRIPGRGRIHILKVKNVNPPLDPEDYEGQLRLINRHLGSMKDLRRGDLIGLAMFMGYRNDGTFIYDGKEAVELSEDPDDCGTVPLIFSVPDEFPVRYWEDLVIHNSYVPFHPDRWMNQLENNFYTFKAQFEGETLQFPATTITHNGHKYVIFGDNYGTIWEGGRKQTPETTITKGDFLQALKKISYLSFPTDAISEEHFIVKHFLQEYDRDHILRLTI